MEESSNDKEPLIARIQQLERERDELHKDIEQLCMQQAGPGYLVVATKMHFQRTAGLEQEIENLKKKLAACTRDNLNLQEELSEAYQIKGQLADLHNVEVTKNKEAEKQLKFFQGCVAAAFAERDHSIMEAEKAKEKEELMSQKLNDNQKRLEELTLDCLEQKKQVDTLQIGIVKQEEQNEIFKKIVDKFYKIRQHPEDEFEDLSWDDKSACLLHDPVECWSYNDPSTSKYISALEEEVETLRNSMENLQNKLRMGLEIENHLKKEVRELQKKKICSDKKLKNELAELRHYHSLHRADIRNLLNEEKSHMKSIIDVVEENIRQFVLDREHNLEASQRDVKLEENECRDVHMSAESDPDAKVVAERNAPVLPDVMADEKANASEALAQAMQEKVAALLLLSQQEERHLLERNVNAALQKKVEELQRNLLQVTNEKVQSLMELARLKQEYQLLQEKTDPELNQGRVLSDTGEKRLATYGRDGRIRNLLKKTYLRRWVGAMDFSGSESESQLNTEGRNFNSSMDFARMRVENATLKESLESMEHLTSSVHRLRLSLLKAKELVTSESSVTSIFKALDDIINEAKLVKTALGSSLPVSWSAEADLGSLGESICNETGDISGDLSSEKIDSVSAAGFEMVELLILAAKLLKDDAIRKGVPEVKIDS